MALYRLVLCPLISGLRRDGLLTGVELSGQLDEELAIAAGEFASSVAQHGEVSCWFRIPAPLTDIRCCGSRVCQGRLGGATRMGDGTRRWGSWLVQHRDEAVGRCHGSL
jgi:hypothetical protein